jgi:alkyl sulfatase BDS1-like metallo-beta-lactamase superfamily hydrolase
LISALELVFSEMLGWYFQKYYGGIFSNTGVVFSEILGWYFRKSETAETAFDPSSATAKVPVLMT